MVNLNMTTHQKIKQKHMKQGAYGGSDKGIPPPPGIPLSCMIFLIWIFSLRKFSDPGWKGASRTKGFLEC